MHRPTNRLVGGARFDVPRDDQIDVEQVAPELDLDAGDAPQMSWMLPAPLGTWAKPSAQSTS